MSDEIVANYHKNAIQTFRNYKKLAEGAIEQVSDEEFFEPIDAEANSIAVVVKHIAGNSISRWSDFLTADGEKPDRDRDSEFEIASETRASLMEFWESGWQALFDNLEPLTVDEFSKTITIRGQSHTIVEAINRQLTHYAYHVGQIVLLAKHFRSTEWMTSKSFTASGALFDCSRPMQCRRVPAWRASSAGHFSRASCTRLSPKSRWPDAISFSISCKARVLLTAIRLTSAGSRRATFAAAAI